MKNIIISTFLVLFISTFCHGQEDYTYTQPKDLGDGWKEEGTDPWYFREFSEKYAYPLGVNIVFYALTH